jgi:branched-chain amino acid transport system permease protein
MRTATGILGLIGQLFGRTSAVGAIALLLAVILSLAFIGAQGNMATLSITLLSGLLRAALLFLVAAGLSLIFGLMDILNFAQGAYFMVGAYLAYDFQHPQSGVMRFGDVIPDPNLRFIVGVTMAVIAGAILGVVLERGLLRRMYDRPLFQLVLTFGVSIIMLEFIKLIWGTTPYAWTVQIGIQTTQFQVFGQGFSAYRLFIIAMGIVLMVSVALLLRYTRIGITIRAGVEDAQMVTALGINVRAVFTLVFTLGCALASFGGAVAAPFLGATPSMGATYLLAGIAVIVLGGLGSYEGTAIGSILVGLAWATMEQFSLFSNIGTVWSSITPMLVLAFVLLARPTGLFGEAR